jgi:hypothetical protein
MHRLQKVNHLATMRVVAREISQKVWEFLRPLMARRNFPPVCPHFA